MSDVTAQQALDEARRELRMRKRVYKGWVIRGHIEESLAAERMARQEKIVAICEEAVRRESGQQDLFADVPYTQDDAISEKG